MSFLGHFSYFWVDLRSILALFWSLEGLWASPGAIWGPLGPQGAPKRGSRSEKLVRWTPPWGPRFGSFFGYVCNFLRLKTHQTKHWFFNGFLGGFWLIFGLIFDECGPKSIKKSLKIGWKINQKISRILEPEIEAKCFQKWGHGPPGSDKKRDQKMKWKNVEKRGMRETQVTQKLQPIWRRGGGLLLTSSQNPQTNIKP